MNEESSLAINNTAFAISSACPRRFIGVIEANACLLSSNQDKVQLAEDLLEEMLTGLEESVGKPYIPGQKIYTTKLNAPSFNIISYIYDNRNFFELIKYDDTLTGFHTKFPQTILKIYGEQFIFQTN